MILVDTNVVVTGLNTRASAHRVCRVVLDGAMARKLPGVLVPQVLLEAYAIITDARRVERPLAPGQAWSEIATLAGALTVLFPEAPTLTEFARIVEGRGPRAQEAFDGFLVAQMRTAGIGTICTLDAKGFSRYPEITVETPESIILRFGLTA